MFKSYYCKWVAGETTYQYIITDDEFSMGTAIIDVRSAMAGSKSNGANGSVWMNVELGYAVIKVYEAKSLNVAANLALAFRQRANENSSTISISRIIASNKRYNPLYSKYENEVEKYLALL